MNIVNIKVGDLVPYDKNTKQHPDWQVEKIAASIQSFGFRVPIVVNDDNVIIQGHGRLLAAKQIGMKEVPCIVASGLADEEQDALRIADNKVAQSDWNEEFLVDELKRLDGLIELEKTGFSFDELDKLLADNSIFEAIDKVTAETKVVPKMERMLNEHNDYIVFVFRNSLDFISACEKLKIKRVDGSLSPKTKKIGIGRVLGSEKLMQVLNEKDDHNKQGQVELNNYPQLVK